MRKRNLNFYTILGSGKWPPTMQSLSPERRGCRFEEESESLLFHQCAALLGQSNTSDVFHGTSHTISEKCPIKNLAGEFPSWTDSFYNIIYMSVSSFPIPPTASPKLPPSSTQWPWRRTSVTASLSATSQNTNTQQHQHRLGELFKVKIWIFGQVLWLAKPKHGTPLHIGEGAIAQALVGWGGI